MVADERMGGMSQMRIKENNKTVIDMKKFFVFLFRIIVTAIVAGLLFFLATQLGGNPWLILLGIAAAIGGLVWAFKL